MATDPDGRNAHGDQVRARLIGGPYDGLTAYLSKTPPRIQVASSIYVRVDDPDTQEYLGGYAHTMETA